MKFYLLVFSLVGCLFADIGRVTAVKGTASIDRNIQKVQVYNDMSLLKQDVIETQQGRLQMLFIDNTVISLGSESRFIIEEYFYEKDAKKVVANFKIEKGFMKTITGAIGKMMPEFFLVQTETTTITPNGTIWSINVDENTENYYVTEGKITLSFKNPEIKRIELNTGESLRLNIATKSGKKVIKSINKLKSTMISQEQKNEQAIEQTNALVQDTLKINESINANLNNIEPVIPVEDDIDDGNNGRGNDDDGDDDSNPGQGNS